MRTAVMAPPKPVLVITGGLVRVFRIHTGDGERSKKRYIVRGCRLDGSNLDLA